jgi:hypothetical protein
VLHERLWRAWSVQKRSVPISPAMYFSRDGLALGAGTILLPAVGPRRLADLQGEEARVLALLAATYGKATPPSVLGAIERAAKSWHEGDDIAAVTHLANAGLPLPVDPAEEARRLFVTDAFIQSGTHPLAILQTLGLDAAYVESIAKYYNEFEPRARRQFDDCEQKTGTMVDYKDKYGDMLKNPDISEFIMRRFLAQALRPD